MKIVNVLYVIIYVNTIYCVYLTTFTVRSKSNSDGFTGLIFLLTQPKDCVQVSPPFLIVYYEYATDKMLVPKHNGEPYVFSPYAMLYNEDKRRAI